MSKLLRKATLKSNVQGVHLCNFRLSVPNCAHVFDSVSIECKRGKLTKSIQKQAELAPNTG